MPVSASLTVVLWVPLSTSLKAVCPGGKVVPLSIKLGKRLLRNTKSTASVVPPSSSVSLVLPKPPVAFLAAPLAGKAWVTVPRSAMVRVTSKLVPKEKPRSWLVPAPKLDI